MECNGTLDRKQRLTHCQAGVDCPRSHYTQTEGHGALALVCHTHKNASKYSTVTWFREIKDEEIKKETKRFIESIKIIPHLYQIPSSYKKKVLWHHILVIESDG